jgi:hypothetical protein
MIGVSVENYYYYTVLIYRACCVCMFHLKQRAEEKRVCQSFRPVRVLSITVDVSTCLMDDTDARYPRNTQYRYLSVTELTVT